MYAKDLNERSPLRLFEKSIHGGLGPGNIGVVVARTGVGKTAFLVGVALDDLMRGRRVLHVALEQPVEHVREHYDEIFADLARSTHLEDIATARLEMERHRNIHTYINHTFSVDRLREGINFLHAHVHFEPIVAIIIEGYPFETATPADLEALRAVAREQQAELWMSAVTHREAAKNARGIPEPVAHVEQAVSVIVSLAHDGKAVHVRLLKDHENTDVSELSIALDPTTMLLRQE